MRDATLHGNGNLPWNLGGSDKVEGGAGAMGRLGMVGFGGGCKQKTTRNISIAFTSDAFHSIYVHKSNLEKARKDARSLTYFLS